MIWCDLLISLFHSILKQCGAPNIFLINDFIRVNKAKIFLAKKKTIYINLVAQKFVIQYKVGPSV